LRGLPIRVVLNPRWPAGLSTSIVAGLDALPADARAALVLLADQPAVAPADLELLIAAWRAAPRTPVAARVGRGFGPPAILPRKLFAQLRLLRGDCGARELLQKPSSRTMGIELPTAAIDVDRPSDLSRLKSGRLTA
jgi:molybdenum cofactor cytidylyltransferase